jgi:hypothetical protein
MRQHKRQLTKRLQRLHDLGLNSSYSLRRFPSKWSGPNVELTALGSHVKTFTSPTLAENNRNATAHQHKMMSAAKAEFNKERGTSAPPVAKVRPRRKGERVF